MRIFLLITIRFLKTDYALLDYVSSLWYGILEFNVPLDTV